MPPTFDTQLRASGLVAIFRGVPQRHAAELARALLEGGVCFIEVSLSGVGATEQIALLRHAAYEGLWIGAGTVTTASQAHEAHAAGAQYLITPHLAKPVADYALEHGLGLISGALTPSEIAAAREHGSRVVKVFPASVMGPSYFKALRGPYPDADLIAVGGIGPKNLADYLAAGAVGAGIGSSLTALDWHAPDFAKARAIAAELVAIIHTQRPQ